MTEASVADIQRVFDVQRTYKWELKRTSAQERKRKLTRLKESVLRHADEVSEALQLDLRKPLEKPLHHEVAGVIADIDDALANLEEWMAPTFVSSSLGIDGVCASINYEPRGVCLVFGPWNFPFLLTLQPLVPLVAAGNCAIVKPNEMAPATGKVVTKILREAFDARDVSVVEGGVSLANALLELPVDHIFFTGSPAIARVVMRAAAKHLSSVTLELGGKCPAVLDETADLKKVAATIGEGRMMNAGQICLCVDHVWVPEGLRDEFVGHLKQFLKERFYTDGRLDKAAFGRIVDGRNLARVKSYLEDAVLRGANVVFGGTVEEEDLTIHPTVLTDVPADATVMQDEIFGPVLPVLSYRAESEITESIRSRGKPLALYVFSGDEAFKERMLAGTSSGGVTVNGWAMQWFESRLPFGGVNESGIGSYHGIYGFREFSHARSIVAAPT